VTLWEHDPEYGDPAGLASSLGILTPQEQEVARRAEEERQRIAKEARQQELAEQALQEGLARQAIAEEAQRKRLEEEKAAAKAKRRLDEEKAAVKARDPQLCFTRFAMHETTFSILVAMLCLPIGIAIFAGALIGEPIATGVTTLAIVVLIYVLAYRKGLNAGWLIFARS
jgi:hypothetical protein